MFGAGVALFIPNAFVVAKPRIKLNDNAIDLKVFTITSKNNTKNIELNNY
jgi:hypothetical protein